MNALFRLNTRLDKIEVKNKASFRMWHVEDLLNQAADLVDRCQSQRQQLRILVDRQRDVLLQAAFLKAESVKTTARLTTQWYSAEARSLSAGQQEYVNEHTARGRARDIAVGAVSPTQNNPPSVTLSAREQEAAFAACSASKSTRESYFASLSADTAPVEQEVRDRNAAIDTWRSAVFLNASAVTFLDEQIKAAEEGAISDFQDALDRASVASEGLTTIYGMKSSDLTLGTESHDLPRGPVEDLSRLDATTLWIRAAIRWLIMRQQLDQEITHIVSLRTKVGDEKFTAIAEDLKRRRPCDCNFTMAADELASHRYVRFRGMRAVTLGCDQTLRATLKFPRLAYSVQGNDTQVELVQANVPACSLGRIDDQAQMRQPELVSPGALVNVSPFGEGKGEEGRFNLTLIPFGAVSAMEDLRLEFIFAAVSKLGDAVVDGD
jgi:hypothetical protein